VNKPAAPYLNHSLEEVERAARRIQNLSGKDRSTAQVAIRFVLSAPAVTSAVLGVRTPEQLEEGIGAASILALSDQEIRALREAVKTNTYAQYR
jgi:aryl-alcohol dehydrogenase-like predicted oxidoreductase